MTARGVVVPRNALFGAFFAFLLAVLATVIASQGASAISSYSPDAGDYGGGNARYALENTPTSPGITSISAPIYFRNNPGTVTVRAYDFYFWGYGGNIPAAQFNGGPFVQGDYAFSVGGFTYDGSTGLWRSVVNVNMNRTGGGDRWAGNLINFRLRLDNTSGWIGYSPSGGGIFSTAAARPWGDGYSFATRRNQGVYNYSLPFAMPCSVTQNRGVTIRLRDMDSGNSDNNGIHMTFGIYNVTRGHFIGYSGRGDASTSGADYFMDFTMEPLHRYQLRISGVSSQNTMQYNIPYDNISYATGCEWNISGASAIKKANSTTLNEDRNWSGSNISATPGEHLYFKHTLNNTGPFNMDRQIGYGIYGSGFSNGSFNGRFAGGNAGPGAVGTFFRYGRVGSGSNGTSYTVYTVTQNDVGNNLCQYIRWSPSGLLNGNANQSGTRCANVPYNYSLTPRVDLNRDGVVEPDTPIAATPVITNTGPTITRSTEWQISKLIIDPGVAIPRSSGGSSNTIPCTYYRVPASIDCSNERSGNTVFNTDGSRRSGDAYGGINDIADDVEVGSRICFTLSVRSRAHNDTNWQHSAPRCVVIGKKPKVQVQGGDIRVGVARVGQPTPSASMILTSQSIKGTTTWGSWGEYGISATGNITGIGSGATLNNGLNNANICSYTLLTFTNSGSNRCDSLPSTVGQYRTTTSLPDVGAAFVVNTLTRELNGTIEPDAFGALDGLYRTTGELVLNGGEVPVGRTIIINAGNNNVRITGNLTYNGGDLTDVDDIPQLIILANNILVNQNVTQVDSWLVANGTLNTCADVPQAAITSENCSAQLTVNGPVIAQRVLLYRTAGSGTQEQSGDPAEVFNLRPDAYLWALGRNKDSARLDTVYQRELPPRY